MEGSFAASPQCYWPFALTLDLNNSCKDPNREVDPGDVPRAGASAVGYHTFQAAPSKRLGREGLTRSDGDDRDENEKGAQARTWHRFTIITLTAYNAIQEIIDDPRALLLAYVVSNDHQVSGVAFVRRACSHSRHGNVTGCL